MAGPTDPSDSDAGWETSGYQALVKRHVQRSDSEPDRSRTAASYVPRQALGKEGFPLEGQAKERKPERTPAC